MKIFLPLPGIIIPPHINLNNTYKRLCLLVVFSCLSSVSLAQLNGIITGKVIDSVTGKGVDFATVSIFKPGATSPFNGASTDGLGNFKIDNLPQGQYRMTIDFLGYRLKSLNNISISEKTTDILLGNVLLAPAAQQLSAVTITAAAPVLENKVDKLVYNAANDLTSQGGVALDVLKKVPLVSVDIDGNVELQGDAHVRFLINGKPSAIFGASLTDALQAIPASQIKSIEVITSPGARYDAAGTAGIINIVLKDSKIKGVNGSVNLSAGTRLQNGSVNLNARNGNIGVSAYFSGNYQLTSTTLYTTSRKSFNPAMDTITRLNQNGSGPFVRNGYQSGFTLNWSITPKNELTATFGLNHTANHGTVQTGQDEQTALSSGTVLADVISNRFAATNFSENAKDLSLAYKKIFSKDGQELNFLYTTSYGSTNTGASQVTAYQNGAYPEAGLQSANPGKDHETDISVDYTHPLTKGFTIETGAKTVLDNITNTVAADTLVSNNAYVPNLSQTYSFNFKRNIYAAYVSSSFTIFNGFFEGKAGLRYEGTHTASNFAGFHIPDNNIWAPSFLIQHKLNETQSIKFAYSYRVERPEYDDLDPFVDVSDPNNISTGNPLLKTETGHKYEVGYNKAFKKGGNIYVGGYYNYNTNDAETLTTFYPVYNVAGVSYYNVSVAQPVNITSQTTFGANIFGSAPLTDKLNVRANLSARQISNAEAGMASVSGLTYRLNLNTTYQFSPTLVAEAFGNYISRRTVYDAKRPAYFFYTIAARKQLFNKKASLGVVANNPFNKYVNQLATSYGLNFNQSNLRRVQLQSFGISLSYKFGKLKVEKEEKDESNAQPEP